MRVQPVRAVVTVAVASAVGFGALALGSTTASAAPRTYVNNCGTVEYKPTDLVLTCADANTMLTELTWAGWSNGRAKGAGTFEVNDCQPTCVAGTTREYPVRVLLSKVKVQGGERLLTKATLTFAKARPAGAKKKVAFTLNPYSGMSASSAPAESTAKPEPTASASATATAAASAKPTPTPSATPSVTAQAIAAPAVTIKSAARSGQSYKITLVARSKASGGKKGITSVTGARANDEGAEISYPGTYLGEDAGDGDQWTLQVGCNANYGHELRVVVRATDRQTSTVKVNMGTC